jgi:Domain of unknown function (DUF4136)
MSNYAKYCVMVAALAATLAACTTLHVTTDVNPSFSVSNCHSYAFAMERNAGGPDAAFGNPLNGDRLRAAIESNMAARGVAKAADAASADCVVGYALGTRQVFNDYYAGWGVGWGPGLGRRGGWGGWGGWGYDGPWVENETRIVVDVFDARAHKAIWHGAVSQSIYDLKGPNADAKINAATSAIFAKLPIGNAPPPAPATRAS